MKTAMQELIEYIELNIDDNDFIKHEVLEEADKAIEKEKEQILEAVEFGLFNADTTIDGQEYYNQKYKLKKEEELSILAKQAQELNLGYEEFELGGEG